MNRYGTCLGTPDSSIHLHLISRPSNLHQAIVLSSNDFEAEHQLSDSLRGIIFLGTPHAGSGLAKFALALGYFIRFSLVKNPNISNVAVLEKDSEVLAGIQDSFIIAITKRERLEKKVLAIHCCIEENPVQGLGRVGYHHQRVQSSPLISL